MIPKNPCEGCFEDKPDGNCFPMGVLYKPCGNYHSKKVYQAELRGIRKGAYGVVDITIDNPYPEGIFPEPSEKYVKGAVKLLTDNGYSSDILHGSWGRKVWDNCLCSLKKSQEEHLKEQGIERLDDD